MNFNLIEILFYFLDLFQSVRVCLWYYRNQIKN